MENINELSNEPNFTPLTAGMQLTSRLISISEYFWTWKHVPRKDLYL